MKTAIRIAAATLIFAASPAFAQLYIAADFNNLHQPNDTVPGADAGLGYRAGQYFGFEGGYEGAYHNIPFSGAYLVGTIYLPLRNTGLEIFADAGALVLTGETPNTGGFTHWASGLRADAGLHYDITSSWGIRAAYRFQTPLAHMTAETVGITYSF
jgi:hypothetical protein